ncbi:excinuclease ABC subunit UvrC [Candidatus Bipolaricaulota bacterium]|nr:excinuclease ABC subunit UvrC [Candidatus Bipolaricaulota bacterium]
MSLKERVGDFPKEAGVYIIRSEGKVIYVGKSASLRDRVKSYFNEGSATSVKTRSLRDEADEIDYIVTDSEVEALVLEENLIKEHRPKYNVLLKDNKRYPYLKLTDEKFPQLEVSRNRGDDSGELFGPYIDSGAMRKTLDTIEKIFPVRDCSWKPEEGYRRPCLRYHIDLCPAPCAGKADRDEYMESIDQIRALLKGKISDVADNLGEKMELASENRDYEKAAEWRDKLEALEKITRDQNVRLSDELDRDFIALKVKDPSDSKKKPGGTIQIFFVRAGSISGQDSLEINIPPGEEKPSILAGFIKKFYSNRRVIPAEIYVEEEPEDAQTIEEWLAEARSGKVEIKVPKRGQKRKVLEMAERNARYNRKDIQSSKETGERKPIETGLKDLREVLSLSTTPRRIEGYDISNISGSDAVGSMVVFEDGSSKNRDYRRFKIQGESDPDDYRMMKEVMRRRFLHGREGSGKKNEEADDSFSAFPDLILIDGGKGQLSAAVKVLKDLSMANIPVIGLAKEYEEVYQPGEMTPAGFSRDSEGLKLLQRVRDEAHRFAVDYHRRLRQKRTVRSSLDAVRGVGPKRKKTLLSTFNSVERISQASLDELKSVSGIPDKVADRVFEFFAEQKD